MKRSARAAARILLLASFLLTLASAAPGFQTGFGKDIAVSGIVPASAVKMVLKRDFQGRYSWSIQGTDFKRIILADRKFRAYVARMEKKTR
ncbi:MAG: hypothetical protein M0Z58_04380 [Nitrospiraceae bacterium]|nr:hypothetical protein [Nitrospiraceae bacterium]